MFRKLQTFPMQFQNVKNARVQILIEHLISLMIREFKKGASHFYEANFKLIEHH